MIGSKFLFLTTRSQALRLYILLLSGLHGFSTYAQTESKELLIYGPYSVAYSDTIILDSASHYNSFGYEGFKPYFLSVWYPRAKPLGQQPLKFGDFFHAPKNSPFQSTKAIWLDSCKSQFIGTYLRENPIYGISEAMSDSAWMSMFQEISGNNTKSYLQDFPKSPSFPVVFYHHGSQGFPFENSIMAEYLASYGFCVVAANFHLPFQTLQFGLLPYEHWGTHHDENSLRFVLKFVKENLVSDYLFFVGHSWGAQMGLRTLDVDTVMSGMVSLETTLEFKTSDEDVKSLWPELHQKLILEKAQYPFPIFFCAATGKYEPFSMFRNINQGALKYGIAPEYFDHNAYISSFYSPLSAESKFTVEINIEIYKSWRLYIAHLTEIRNFFEGIINNIPQNGLIELK